MNASQTCPSCGQTLPSDMRFCTSCGTALPEAVARQAPSQQRWRWLAGAAGLVVIVAGAWFVLRDDGSTPPKNAVVTSSEPAATGSGATTSVALPASTTPPTSAPPTTAVPTTALPTTSPATTAAPTTAPPTTSPATTAAPTSTAAPPTVAPTTTPVTTPYQHYIGATYPVTADGPAGITSLGGELVGDTGLAVNWAQGPEGDMFWLVRAIETNPDGSVVTWQVIDIIAVPPKQDDGDTVIMGGTQCRIGLVERTGVVAIFEYTDSDWYTVVRQAWTIEDPGVFVPVAAPVSCRNEAAGV